MDSLQPFALVLLRMKLTIGHGECSSKKLGICHCGEEELALIDSELRRISTIKLKVLRPLLKSGSEVDDGLIFLSNVIKTKCW